MDDCSVLLLFDVDSADSGMYDCSVFDEEEGNLVGIYKYNVTSKSEHVT